MKKNKLFDLINSLNKTEKRHFSKFTNKNSQSGDSTYIKLYKEIDKMTIYDKPKLVKKFGESKLKTNSTYLYNQILISLRVLHRESNDYKQILNNIIDITTLIEKQLYSQAESMVDKSIVKADKINKLFIKIKLTEFKFQLLKLRNKNINYYIKSLELKQSYEQTLISINKKLKLGFYVGNFVHLLEKDFVVKDKSQLDVLTHFINDEDYKSYDDTLGDNAEFDRLTLLAIIYNRRKDYNNSFKYALKSFEFSSKQKTFKTISSNIVKYGNILTSAIPVNNEIVFNNFIEKLKRLKITYKSKSQEKRSLIDFSIIFYKLNFFAMNKKYFEIEKEYDSLFKEFIDLKKSVTNLLYPEIYLFAYIIEFNAENYDKSLNLLNEYEFTIGKEVTFNKYESLFKILCLYKLGSDDVALNLLETFKRKNSKNKEDFYKTITSFILNVIINKTNKNNIDNLKKLDTKKFDVFEKSLFEWCMNECQIRVKAY